MLTFVRPVLLLVSLLLLSAWKPGDVLRDSATDTTYTVIQVLGDGTFGDVARVTRKRPDGSTDEIALKIVKPEKGEKPLAGYRFLREKSPDGLPSGLLPFEQEVKLKSGHHAIPMPLAESVGDARKTYRIEYLPNADLLKERLATMERFMNEGLENLQQLVELGAVHGDIKPSNLFLRNGRLVFGDFDGAAKIGAVDNALTLMYAPPEVARHAATEPTTDLYAFGATLFALMFNDDPLSDYLIAVKHMKRGKIPREVFEKYLRGDGSGVAEDIRKRFDNVARSGRLNAEDLARLERLKAFVLSATDHQAGHRADGLLQIPGAAGYLNALKARAPAGPRGPLGMVCKAFGWF